MTESRGAPLTAEMPADTEEDPDLLANEVVEDADDLPDDVPNDDLAPEDAIEAAEAGPVVDTDTDAPVIGTPDDPSIDLEDFNDLHGH